MVPIWLQVNLLFLGKPGEEKVNALTWSSVPAKRPASVVSSQCQLQTILLWLPDRGVPQPSPDMLSQWLTHLCEAAQYCQPSALAPAVASSTSFWKEQHRWSTSAAEKWWGGELHLRSSKTVLIFSACVWGKQKGQCKKSRAQWVSWVWELTERSKTSQLQERAVCSLPLAACEEDQESLHLSWVLSSFVHWKLAFQLTIFIHFLARSKKSSHTYWEK